MSCRRTELEGGYVGSRSPADLAHVHELSRSLSMVFRLGERKASVIVRFAAARYPLVTRRIQGLMSLSASGLHVYNLHFPRQPSCWVPDTMSLSWDDPYAFILTLLCCSDITTLG